MEEVLREVLRHSWIFYGLVFIGLVLAFRFLKAFFKITVIIVTFAGIVFLIVWMNHQGWSPSKQNPFFLKGR